MAIKSNLKNMVLVLTAVCLICSAVLAGVYSLTKAPIDKAAADKTNNAISLVVPAFDNTEKATVTAGERNTAITVRLRTARP